MSLLDLLQTVGGRLGILEAPSRADAGEPGKVVTRTVTLEELRSQVHSEDVRALAELPAELSLPFEKIFEAAGVNVPAHGWTVARLKALLLTEPFQRQERANLQLALLNTLHSAHVPAEDLVKEAVAQDQALDAFESFVCNKAKDHMATAGSPNWTPGSRPSRTNAPAWQSACRSSRRICAPGDAASELTNASSPQRWDISPIDRSSLPTMRSSDEARLDVGSHRFCITIVGWLVFSALHQNPHR
jgi:hypothetical protein